MKKIVCVFAVLLCLFTFSGCKQTEFQQVEANMSEITQYYFSGMSENARASISVGQRENPYIKDGLHESLCDFSLISLTIDGFLDMRKTVRLYINDELFIIELELVSGTYMCDLGYKLSPDDSIKIAFEDQQLVLLRQEFKIGSDAALVIGCKQVLNEINLCRQENVAFECYLKLLNKMGASFEGVFWCFTLLEESGQCYNIIIDVESGEILK